MVIFVGLGATLFVDAAPLFASVVATDAVPIAPPAFVRSDPSDFVVSA